MSPSATVPTHSKTFCIVTCSPWNSPGIIEPPYRKTLGRSVRMEAIIMPGMFLSHPPMVTRPSTRSPKATSSTESAMTSRETSDAFMPSVPIDIASEIVMVPNSMGIPPEESTPS
jgi:hypothetical protein